MKISDAIQDPGLRMGALGALLDAEQLQESTLASALDAAVAEIRAREDYWYDDNGERKLAADEWRDEVLQHGVDALGSVTVTAELLAGITELSFDGGNEIYMWFEAALAERLGLEDWELDTGGESELYLVNRFDGLDAMTGLVRLHLDAYGWTQHERDAAPFAKLAALTTLNLAGAKLRNAGVLTTLPNLRSIRGSSGLDEATCAGLTAANVELA